MLRIIPTKFSIFFLGLSLSFVANASDTDVIDVKVSQSGGQYRFDVTLKHADTGWDHYANVWEIVGPGGEVLGTRVLAHPHVDEQPFTRSLGGVVIPAAILEVTIRAGDNVNGLGGKTMSIALPSR